MKHYKNLKKTSGSTLVLMLVIIIIMLIMGSAMLTVGFDSQLISIKAAQVISARSAAEAGAAQGLKKVNDKVDSGWDLAWLPYSTTTPIALEGTDATYTYTIGDASTNHVITATGTDKGISRTVYITLKPTTTWFGIGVKDTIDIGSSATFGAVCGPDDGGLRIQTNSIDDCAITIFPNTDIPGELVVGPGGSVDAGICQKPNTNVDNTFVALDAIPFDPVVIPPIFDSMTAVAYNYDPNAPALSGTWKFIDMIIPQGAIQVIDDPGNTVMIYVVGNTRIHQDAELRLTDGTALRLYVNNDFEAKQGSRITNPNIDPACPLYPDPRMLRIYGTDNCTSIILKNSGGFSGAIYAPNADIIIMNEGDFIGGVMGNSLEVKNSGGFLFDTRLASGDIWEEFAGFVVDRWWEE